jgi:hypothetical protein
MTMAETAAAGRPAVSPTRFQAHEHVPATEPHFTGTEWPTLDEAKIEVAAAFQDEEIVWEEAAVAYPGHGNQRPEDFGFMAGEARWNGTCYVCGTKRFVIRGY